MKLNKLVLIFPTLFAISLSSYAVEMPPASFPIQEATPNIDNILNNSGYTDGYAAVAERWSTSSRASMSGNKYIIGENMVRTRPGSSPQIVYLRDNAHSIHNTFDSIQITLESNAIAIGTTLKGSVDYDHGNGLTHNS